MPERAGIVGPDRDPSREVGRPNGRIDRGYRAFFLEKRMDRRDLRGAIGPVVFERKAPRWRARVAGGVVGQKPHPVQAGQRHFEL